MPPAERDSSTALTGSLFLAHLGECKIAWVLKNPDVGSGPKLHRVRMPYKRFVGSGWPFTIPQNRVVLMNIEFFNSHSPMHSSTCA
jgi:hypothetical protein